MDQYEAARRIRSAQHDPVALPYAHHVVDGIYMRTCAVVADTLVVGRKYLRGGTWQILQGSMLMFDFENRTHHVASAGQFGVSAPGSQRIVVGLEHCVFSAQHAVPKELSDLYLTEPDRALRELEEYLYGPSDDLPSTLDWVTGGVKPEHLTYHAA